MKDYTTLENGVSELAAKEDKSSITPAYLANLLNKFIAQIKAVDASDAAADAKLSDLTLTPVTTESGAIHLRLSVAQADGTNKSVTLTPATDSAPGLLAPGMHAQFWQDHQTVTAHKAQIGSLAAELAQMRLAVTGAGAISVGASAAYPLTLSVADGAGRLGSAGVSSLTVAEYRDGIAVSAPCRLTIDNKYNIQKLAAQTEGLLDGFDIAQLRHSSLLSYLYLYGGCARGWLSDLPVSPLRQLDIRFCKDLRGRLSSLSGYGQVQLIRLCGCPVEGDVADLSGCSALTALDLHDTAVSGELTDLLDAMAAHRDSGELTVDLRGTDATCRGEAIAEVLKVRFSITAPGWQLVTSQQGGWSFGGSTETPSIDVGVPQGGEPLIGAAYRMSVEQSADPTEAGTI